MDALARLGLGRVALAAGRPKEAIEEFELALRRQPALVAAHIGIGNALAMMMRNEEALARYEQALALRPRLPEAEFAAGFVLARMGKQKEAETRYRRALVLRPDFAAAWINLGSLLREQGREVYAEAALRAPSSCARIWSPAGSTWRFWSASATVPPRLKPICARPLRSIRSRWRRWWPGASSAPPSATWPAPGSGCAGLWRASRITQKPSTCTAFCSTGRAASRRRSQSLNRPRLSASTAAASNRGNSLLDMGRMEEGSARAGASRRARSLSHGARYNLALTRLRLGDWQQGWPEYEARWRFREVHRSPRVFSQPRWQGEALNGRRILLHAEQGLGDTIQFCRYVSLVGARGGRIIFQVQQPTLRLMRSFAAVRAGLVEVVPLGVSLPEFDWECPLMSLPAVFRTTIETVPWSKAYLDADPALVEEKWKEFSALQSSTRSLRVGVAWAGNPNYKADRQRSVKLSTLLPLLRTTGVTWISLQKGPPAEEIVSLPEDIKVQDGSSRDRDLAETAALVATLDLVITTDTCIAHLAGALAKPVWILLPHLADWRWMQQTETTPWYPTARLFRQHAPSDWAGVLECVIGKLNDLSAIESSRATRPERQNRQNSQLIHG